jgi:hypothetical protein
MLFFMVAGRIKPLDLSLLRSMSLGMVNIRKSNLRADFNAKTSIFITGLNLRIFIIRSHSGPSSSPNVKKVKFDHRLNMTFFPCQLKTTMPVLIRKKSYNFRPIWSDDYLA